MKRFWDTATLTTTPDGHQLLLDGIPLRLPEGGLLVIASPPLAQAIRDEWQAAGGAKGGEVHHNRHLPLTQFHTTAAIRVAEQRDAIIDSIAAYGESDLLCYRAASPRPLREKQDNAWQIWLDWAALTLDAPLLVAEGIVHVAQPAASLAALRAALNATSNEELAVLGVVVPATGSLVLGLAMIKNVIDAKQLHEAAIVDEQFQIDFWGEDAEGMARLAHLATELALAERFLTLVRST